MATPAVTPVGGKDSADVRTARRWQYLLILIQEAKIDPKQVPPGMGMYVLMSPYERRGYTAQDIESWIDICDPVIKPAWDEITCFRNRVRQMLQPKPALGTAAAIAAGVAFAGAFLLTRRSR